MVSVFSFLNYREFLKAAYGERKSQNPAFSYRFIAQRVGINASTFVRIVQGRRNLTGKMIAPVCGVFRLGKKESSYFELLVNLDQARSASEKKLYFEKAISFNKCDAMPLLADRYALFEFWYYIAVRELLGHYRFCGDYDKLAGMLAPPISPGQAKRAIALLLRLGLIKKDSHGCFRPTEKIVTTGENWRSFAIANFQKSTIALAGEAIERFMPEDRDISTLTVNLSAKGIGMVKEKIQALRKEILEVENMDAERDRVFQVNFQIFPMSKSSKGPGR
jgi:uncharacterized protein (TIGR02147 family)